MMPSVPGHRLCRVPAPCSSTQCELAAISLASEFKVQPKLILTDSLCSLQLIASWSCKSAAAVLSCPHRVEVRHFLYAWRECASPPTLQKVKAHDQVGRREAKHKTLATRRPTLWQRVPLPEPFRYTFLKLAMRTPIGSNPGTPIGRGSSILGPVLIPYGMVTFSACGWGAPPPLARPFIPGRGDYLLGRLLPRFPAPHLYTRPLRRCLSGRLGRALMHWLPGPASSRTH